MGKQVRKLEKDEEEFCKQLHPDVAPFAKKKRPLLLTAILDELGFGPTDMLLQFMAPGFPMFGQFPLTGIFPKRHHGATISTDDLPAVAKWARPAMVNSRPVTKDPAIEEEL